jgi:hypothetical protein
MIAELAVTSGLGSSFDPVVAKSLWNLCDYFVPLCAFVIILGDIFRHNLIG